MQQAAELNHRYRYQSQWEQDQQQRQQQSRQKIHPQHAQYSMDLKRVHMQNFHWMTPWQTRPYWSYQDKPYLLHGDLIRQECQGLKLLRHQKGSDNQPIFWRLPWTSSLELQRHPCALVECRLTCLPFL